MKKRNDFIWDTGWTMNLFSRMVREVSGKFPTAPDSAGETSEPAMDIFEDDHDVVIEIEVPGLRREDIRVRIDQDVVCIEGYKRGQRDTTCLTYLCLERQYGIFRRFVKIPVSVDTTSVQAVLRDGILRIRLPRISDRRRSVVEVQIGDGQLPSREGDR